MIERAVITFCMKSAKKQRIRVKLRFRVRKIGSEAHSILREGYGNDALSHMMTYE
jgi:hypothetical protein